VQARVPIPRRMRDPTRKFQIPQRRANFPRVLPALAAPGYRGPRGRARVRNGWSRGWRRAPAPSRRQDVPCSVIRSAPSPRRRVSPSQEPQSCDRDGENCGRGPERRAQVRNAANRLERAWPSEFGKECTRPGPGSAPAGARPRVPRPASASRGPWALRGSRSIRKSGRPCALALPARRAWHRAAQSGRRPQSDP